jgi:hypothetical protein
MSRRNKDKEININLTENDIVMVIDSLDFVAGSQDQATYDKYKKLAGRLDGCLSRFLERRIERDAQRKTGESKTSGSAGECSTVQPVRELPAVVSGGDVQGLYSKNDRSIETEEIR